MNIQKKMIKRSFYIHIYKYNCLKPSNMLRQVLLDLKSSGQHSMSRKLDNATVISKTRQLMFST